MRMHLKWHQAQAFLKEEEQIMSERTWYRWRQRLTKETQERLFDIAKYEHPIQHQESIEEIKVARKVMWQNIWKIKDPFKQNIAIQNVLNTLPLKSDYYDATKDVIEKPAEVQKDTTIQEQESEQQPNEWV